MSKNTKLVPKRRFKEFKMATQWYNTNFFSVINNVIDFRGRTPKKLGMSWSDDGYLALSALNVKNGFIDFNVDAHYGDTELYQKWMSGNELKKGQVIFTTEAPMGNVTQIPDDRGYILSQRTIAFETNKLKMTDNFLAITLNSPNVKISLSTIASGGTAKGVSQNSLKSLRISLPESLTEQTQIGEFFKKLDTLIQTQQKKLDKTKTLKAAYLAEMFPCDGKLMPKLQFKDFINYWDSISLNKIGSTYAGLSGKSKDDFGHGNAEYITYVNIFNNPITDLDGTETIEIDDKQNQVKYGDVLFTISSETPHEVGLSSVWLGDRENVYLNSFCFGFRPYLNVDNYYFAFMLRSPVIRKKFKILAQGISRYNVSKNRVMKLVVPITHINEQTKIGNFFKLLDKRIALEQRKLEKLNNIKQAYLNEMFV